MTHLVPQLTQTLCWEPKKLMFPSKLSTTLPFSMLWVAVDFRWKKFYSLFRALFIWLNQTFSTLVVYFWWNSVHSVLDWHMEAIQFLWENWRELGKRITHLMFAWWEPLLSKQCLNILRFFPTFPDIKVKEQTVENMMKNRPIFEPPRFMSNQQAAEQLMEVVKTKNNASSI